MILVKWLQHSDINGLEVIKISGITDLKERLNLISKDNYKDTLYIAKVISLKPFKVSNAYFGIVERDQLYCSKSFLNYNEATRTSTDNNHSHTLKYNDVAIGDDLLLMLYEQEIEQKFIILDKIVKM